jgi:aspartyl protease family protein
MSTHNDQSSHTIGRWMTYLAWIIFLGLLTLAFKKYLDRQNNPNQNPATHYNSDQIAEVTLLQNRQGHYLANGKINDITVTFLLDTGATHISIPEHIAQRLKLAKGFPSQTRTANGTITVYDTRLNSVSIGTIELNNIRASINPYMQGDEILLGMSFMKHLELIQRDRQLILRNPL